jgi:hypothetical protein
MAYTFARIGAVVALTPQDYLQVGKRSLIRFREKGGKEKEIPVHHKLEEYLDVYLQAAKLSDEPATPFSDRLAAGRASSGPMDSHAKMLGRCSSGGCAMRDFQPSIPTTLFAPPASPIT